MKPRPLADSIDEGLSLAELIVSIMIVSLVLVVGATLTVSTLQQQRFTTAKTNSQADTRLALRQLSRDLRTAVPNPYDTTSCVDAYGTPSACKSAFSFASGRKITFFTSKGGGTPMISRVTYEVQGGTNCLYRTEIKATGGTFNAANAKAHCVGAGQVRNGASDPIFTFSSIRPDFATAGAAVTPPATGITLTRTTDDDLASIVGVTVNLTMTAQNQPNIAGTRVSQSITLVNSTNSITN